jgi:hypothetical protein
MKKCILNDSTLERIEQHPTIKALSAQISKVRNMLLANLPPEQADAFREYDDLCLLEGTARVQAAIRELCGCPECNTTA